MAGFAVRIDRMRERLEIFHNRGDSWLRGVRAVAVGAAAVRGRTVRTAAVTILRVPVVGAGAGLGFSTSSTTPAFAVPGSTSDVVGWYLGMALAVAEPDGIAVAEHDVVEAGTAADGLVEIVAHRVIIGEALEVGRVALLHIVEAQGGGAFTGGGGAGQVVGVEIGGLGQAVGAGADGDFHPGEQTGVARHAFGPTM